MKRFTLLEAIKEINATMPINTDLLVSISYEDGSKTKFILYFPNDKYFVNLNDYTYSRLSS